MDGKGSAEYRTLIACTTELRLAVRSNLSAISGDLLGKGLISQDNESAISNQAISEAERVAELVRLVQDRVQENPQHYSTFISILQLDQVLYKDTLNSLDETFSKEKASEPGDETTVGGILKDFKISLETMKKMKEFLMADFKRGLEEEGDHVKVKMFPTFIHSLPNGTEEGEFLALEMTGAKYCIQKYRIEHGRITEMSKIEEHLITGGKVRPHIEVENKDALSSHERIDLEDLFDEIALKMSKFIKEGSPPVGFSFSFPIKHISINSGKLPRWTKEVVIDSAVDKELIHILKTAFIKLGVGVNVVAFINNTTGIMLSVASEVQNCYIGVVLGQGCNASYMEKVDAVTKLKGDVHVKKHSDIIINCEWGAFGEQEHGKLYKWTIYDHQVDKETTNCGEQLFEKMICGNFLGDIVQLVLKKLIQDEILLSKFDEGSLPKFHKSVLKAEDVSIIESGTEDDCKRLLEEKFSVEASKEDCEIVRRVCTAVSTRSARIAATAIVALVEKINKLNSGCTVAVDGSLYNTYYNYAKRLEAAMEELAPGNEVKIVQSKYGARGGAAIAAAIACRSTSSSDDK